MTRHWGGYLKARGEMLVQSLEDDLELIDTLFGRDNLRYGDSPEAVKREALRQLELEWRVPEDYTGPID